MRHLLSLVSIALILFLLLGLVPRSQAQPGGGTLAGTGYDLSWNTIDGGGTTSASNGGYELSGAIGQPEAGAQAGSKGYTLAGGFWVPASSAAVEYRVFLPLVIRN